jgi:hypothetical protein
MTKAVSELAIRCPATGNLILLKGTIARFAGECEALSRFHKIPIKKIAMWAEAAALFGSHAIPIAEDLRDAFDYQEAASDWLAKGGLTTEGLRNVIKECRKSLSLFLCVEIDPAKRKRMNETLAEIDRRQRDLTKLAIQAYARQRGKECDAEGIVRSIEDGSFFETDAEQTKMNGAHVNGYANDH